MLDTLLLLANGKQGKAKSAIMKRTLAEYYHTTMLIFSFHVIKLIVWNKMFPNKKLVNRIKALGKSNKDTLGYYLYQYYVTNKFPFPGTGVFLPHHCLWDMICIMCSEIAKLMRQAS